MAELAARLLLAVLAIAGTWLSSPATGLEVAKVLGVFAVVSAFSFLLERKGERNAGASGLIAVADSIAIALTLGLLGHLNDFGFLVLAPCAYAAARYGSLPTAMAPLAASSLALSHALSAPNLPPEPGFYGQMLAVLAVGLLLNHRRIVVTESRPIDLSELQPASEGPPPEAYMELRQSYRLMRDHLRDLMAKSKRDRTAVEVFELLHDRDPRPFEARLTELLRSKTSASGAVLHRASRLDEAMVVRHVDGSVPEALRSEPIVLDLKSAAASVRQAAHSATAALVDSETGKRMANVPLVRDGHLEGMLTLFADVQQLPLALDAGSELAPVAALALSQYDRAARLERRTVLAELLYSLSTTMSGASTPTHLAARVVQELAHLTDCEQIGVAWIDGDSLLTASHIGASLEPLSLLSFGAGPGLDGWKRHGAGELWLPETLKDARFLRPEGIRSRLRSLALAPIFRDAEVFGYLYCASPRGGAAGAETMEAVRLAAAGIAQAIAHLESGDSAMGQATFVEFQELAGKKPGAMLIHLEPVRKEAIIESQGLPAFEHALRTYELRLRGQLPEGGLMCRREGEGFLVLLPCHSLDQAQSWANSVAAMASFIGWSSMDGSLKVPLAFRARVGESSGGTSAAAEAVGGRGVRR